MQFSLSIKFQALSLQDFVAILMAVLSVAKLLDRYHFAISEDLLLGWRWASARNNCRSVLNRSTSWLDVWCRREGSTLSMLWMVHVEEHLVLAHLERVKVVRVDVLKIVQVELWLTWRVWPYEVYLFVVLGSNCLQLAWSLFWRLLKCFHVDLQFTSLRILSALLNWLVVLKFLLAFV